ncbi:hypothetical protein GCM10007160_04000 [Litchfieldella qijiaojingensis]|uniref:Uncharacterized protein n=1 Tax=Litchfieldella qijiaojingensis TaxID=980347 RepID=A0ABQ2YFA8_9GAMM|nr:hypothetical protein [Halomonas qijiaojingensis]GGX79784.1 hypothetical protein GCM10007160_04000 [Halomonas qijiaojingensis]
MSAVRIDLERIDISLHGVSAELVQEALDGLEAALSRQLQGVKASERPLALTGISLAPQHVSPHVTSDEMRDLLVQQIVMAVERALHQGVV